MDASAWIALAGLAAVLFVQCGAMAFALGGLFARLKTLESRPIDVDCKAELAVLTVKFEALKSTLDEMANDVKNMLTGRVIPARRRVSDDA